MPLPIVHCSPHVSLAANQGSLSQEMAREKSMIRAGLKYMCDEWNTRDQI